MLHRLILNVNKFQLPTPEPLGTVVKNILGVIMPPMSNGVKRREHKYHKVSTDELLIDAYIEGILIEKKIITVLMFMSVRIQE